MDKLFFAHPTAEVSKGAVVGSGTKIWNQAQVREGASLGESCVVGKNVYVDIDVRVGDRVKIENNCSLFGGAVVEDWVFMGPHVVLTNDRFPRAVRPDGALKGTSDWNLEGVTVRRGASLGANVTVLPGVTIGRWAMVGAGSVVTRDVPDFGLALGNPARIIGFVCKCGRARSAELKDVNCECLGV